VSIRFRPAAVGELADLLARIRSANPQAADEVQDSVQRTLELLEANPLSGSRIRFRNPNLRELRYATARYYPQFVILYLPVIDGVEVLHIVRGRRNLKGVVAND
jgi:plasmid stabilization system protein ParE